MKMTVSKPRLRDAGRADIGGYDCVYGLGMLMQIAPTRALALVNRRPVGVPVIDYEDGVDCFVFDSPANLSAAEAQPVFRNSFGEHPRTGERLMFVVYPSGGGFVPLGARREDGVPHPHAGTGFALAKVMGFAATNGDRPPKDKELRHTQWELAQLRFDGRDLQVASREVVQNDSILPGGISLERQPVSCAIADADELLLPMSGSLGEQLYGVGVARWRMGDRGWRPERFEAVTPPDMSFEPSLLRDVDGALLLTVRGYGHNDWHKSKWPADQPDSRDAFRLYRSADGKAWQQTLYKNRQRGVSPVVLNATADGTPYLASNPLRPTHVNRDGRTCKSSWMREEIFAWPLNDARDGVLTPYSLFNAREQLGPTRSGLHHVNYWYIDHPIGGAFRLADGAWHSLLGLRVCEQAEVFAGAEPVEATGYWLEELSTDAPGQSVPPWRF